MITLIDRGMLLFYYCAPPDAAPWDLNEDQYAGGVIRLIDAGLLKAGDGLEVTEAGKVFCEALREVNLPVQVWMIPRASAAVNEGLPK